MERPSWLRVTRRARPWRGWPAAFVGVSLLALAGCGAAPASSTSHPSALTIALSPQYSPDWWAPLVPTTSCGTVSGGMVTDGTVEPWQFLPLILTNSRDQIAWSQSIAQSITHNAAGTQYVVHLNPVWKWSNGQPVTAADVVYDFQLEAAASQANSPLPFCFAGEGGMPTLWKSVRAVNQDTVVINTTQPVNANWFELNGVALLNPVPKSVWDRYSNMTQELQWIKSIGNAPFNPVYKVQDGPYILKKAVTDQYWEFVANPHFSGTPKPQIKTLVYDYETSYASIFAALKKDTVQVAPYDLSLWGSRGQLTNDVIHSAPLFAYSEIQVNFAKDAPQENLLSQLYIRQALQYGIDQSGIAAKIFDGQAQPSYGPAPTLDDAYYDKAMGNLYPFDPAKGKALLEAHGWRLNASGVMEKNGQVLAFTVLFATGTPSTTDELELMKADWAKEGINVTLKGVGGDTFGGIVGNPQESSKWSLAGGGGWIYAPDYYPTGDGLFNGPGGFNVGAYNNPRETELVAKTLQPGSPASVKRIFDQYQVYTFQQLPVLFAPTPKILSAVSKQVAGWGDFNVVQAFVDGNALSWK
jgi:peptide/nickel transport system substrate-binding protein